jgi:calcineurin-like phosphoesterase family protein
MGNILFTSDTHWSHKRVIEYSNRPFSSAEEMDETLIKNWNRMVRPNDTIYHLGDFAFMKIDKLIPLMNRLNGNLHIILGNHDKEIIRNKKMIFDSVEGIRSIVNYLEIKHNNIHINLFHYPLLQFNKCHYGSWALHGHCHGSVIAPGKQVDVGVDSALITGKAEYRPFSIEEIEQFMKTREIIDHHAAD